jgi:hypothetical protein
VQQGQRAHVRCLGYRRLASTDDVKAHAEPRSTVEFERIDEVGGDAAQDGAHCHSTMRRI